MGADFRRSAWVNLDIFSRLRLRLRGSVDGAPLRPPEECFLPPGPEAGFEAACCNAPSNGLLLPGGPCGPPRGGRPRAPAPGGPPARFGGPPALLGGPPALLGGPPALFGGPPALLGGPPARFGGPPALFGGPPARFGGLPARFGGVGVKRPCCGVFAGPLFCGLLGSLSVTRDSLLGGEAFGETSGFFRA